MRRVSPRPDPTRSARTGEPCGLGQDAWGWKPELLAALPRAYQSKRWRQEEEQRESIPWLRVADAETAGSLSRLARRFNFGPPVRRVRVAALRTRCARFRHPGDENDGGAGGIVRHYARMTPVYSMPRGAAAQVTAALHELRSALAAVRCAAVLLVSRQAGPPGRQIVSALLEAASRAEAAASRVARTAHLMIRADAGANEVPSASVAGATRHGLGRDVPPGRGCPSEEGGARSWRSTPTAADARAE